MNNDQLKHIASALNAIAFAEFAAFGYARRATHRFGFRTALRFSGVIQIILLNMLIVNGKINSFKFCCAPADFIEEKPSFSAILGQKTCVSAQIHPLVRKHPLEALTSTASRGYSFN